jgi:hypothetical protein
VLRVQALSVAWMEYNLRGIFGVFGEERSKMNFVPEQPKNEIEVPWFDDVTSEGGWQGHSTNKSTETLKSEVSISLSRLGAIIRSFQQGKFVTGGKERDGYRISYFIEKPNGVMVEGRLDIAALPVKLEHSLRRSLKTRRERSLRMALFMARNALDGTWFLQQLSPGYAPLVPFMLVNKTQTVSELWVDGVMKNLLPPGDSDFDEVIDAEYKEMEGK